VGCLLKLLTLPVVPSSVVIPTFLISKQASEQQKRRQGTKK